jgi:hypothetical protein
MRRCAAFARDEHSMTARLIARLRSPRRIVQIIRHRYFDDFVFIHINKTGGSSIERALHLPFEHKTALEKIEELGRRRWEKRYTFAVVRNPWDKVVSHYHYRVQTNQTELGERPVQFKEWVRLAYRERDPLFHDNPKMFMPQTDWIADADGVILVDFVCRFENLNNDFGEVCRRLGKSISLPHLKSSRRGAYQQYYDDETVGIVEDWFGADIRNFDYAF